MTEASNMSGITTTQSTIAEDLDAFSEASWFTSAYLVSYIGAPCRNSADVCLIDSYVELLTAGCKACSDVLPSELHFCSIFTLFHRRTCYITSPKSDGLPSR